MGGQAGSCMKRKLTLFWEVATAIAANAAVGMNPDQIVDCIDEDKKVRQGGQRGQRSGSQVSLCLDGIDVAGWKIN